MSTSSLEVKGLKEIRAKLAHLAHNMPKKAEQAVRLQAEYIMTDAKRNYVPVDLGALRASGKVDKPTREGDSITVHMHFGDNAAPYALTIHEHPSPHDPPSWKGSVYSSNPVYTRGVSVTVSGVKFHPSGRGPKYLERPFKAAIPGMMNRMHEQLAIQDSDLTTDTAPQHGFNITGSGGEHF